MKVVFGDVAVVVKDGKAAAKWWKEKLGFEIRDNVGHWITVAPPGSEGVVLHLCGPDEGYAVDPGNTGIGFYVDDVGAAEKKWSAKGVKFTKPRTQGAASVQAKFLDLDGNEYWLFEDEDLRAKPRPKPTKSAKKKSTKKKAAKKPKSR